MVRTLCSSLPLHKRSRLAQQRFQRWRDTQAQKQHERQEQENRSTRTKTVAKTVSLRRLWSVALNYIQYSDAHPDEHHEEEYQKKPDHEELTVTDGGADDREFAYKRPKRRRSGDR